MRNNSLALVTVIALFVNTVGLGLAPPLAVAAPAPESDFAWIGALPPWFTGAPAVSEAEGHSVIAHSGVLPAWFAMNGAGATSPTRGDVGTDLAQATAPEAYTYTDGAGGYRFDGLPNGTHKVTLDAVTLPPSLRGAEGEPVPVLWINPGQELTSAPLSTGVRFSAAYDRENGIITGLVFVDQDSDGQASSDEPGLPGVRVIDPTVHQYYVPFNDANLWALFDDKNTGLPGAQLCHPTGVPVAGTLDSSIFIIASSDGTVFYYDHWEDGYDADPLAPGPTTEAGVLDAGVSQVFQDDVDPALVSDQSVFFYDGRDRITVVGEEASVVRLVFPSTPGEVLAAAWEVPETADWGTEYIATLGEDLDFNGATVDDHDFAGLEVMAALPGTEVYHNGSLATTLGPGETYFINGANNGPAGGGVDSTDRITATASIQVQMMTGGCDDRYSAHGYSLQPVNAWCEDYWAPVPGFVPGCGPSGRDADTDLYVHNPHPYEITVSVSSDMGTLDMSIPSETTVSVLDESGWTDLSTGNQGTHLSSLDTFWGVGVIDSSTNGTSASNIFDWGYALVPQSNLSSQVIVGYAPGNEDDPPMDNGNLAYVTAIIDAVIYVDLNRDGLPDPFDMNGDGDRSDSDVFSVPEWDEPLSALGIPVQAGQALRVGDPNDRNLTGALIYTMDLAEKIAVAWGQDPCQAEVRYPYMDLGYTVLPLSIPRLSKFDDLAIDADLTGAVSPGDTITYTIVLYNNGTGPMRDVVLTDTLPYTYTDFVVGSIDVTTPPPVRTIEYYDGTPPWTTTPTPDAQMFRVLWDTIEPAQEITITLRVQLHTDIPVTVTEITNQAVVDSANTEPRPSEDPDDPPDPDTDTPVERPLLSIDKRVSPPTVQPGGIVDYTVVVSNYGNGVALLTAITDTLPSWLEYITGTLDLTWPIAQVEVTTRTFTDTSSFHGHYADDFDLSATQSTNYSGNDGSLIWSTDWSEVNDDGNPSNGEVQVWTDGTALSEPAHVWMEGTASAGDVGVERTFDLAEFQAPWLRYYVAGTTSGDGNDYYRVEVTGVSDYNVQYDGDYTIGEIDLSAAAGNPAVTLGLIATGGIEAGESYRFDHIAIYETDSLREVPRTLTYESTVLSYTSSTGGDPVSYDRSTGHMVITQGMRLPASGFITMTFQAQVSVPLTDDLTLANTACTTSANWLQILSPPCDDASVQVDSSHTLSVTKSADPSPVAMGGLLTYTIHYTMTGDEAVESMVVRDTTPADTTFFAATPPPIEDPGVGNTGPVIWQMSGLWPPGSDITQATGALTMVVLVDSTLFSGTLINNTVFISDTSGLTDTDPTTTPVQQSADLAIFKVDTPDPVIPGSSLTYTLDVVNNGPSDAVGAVVSDTLPPEVTLFSTTPPQTGGPNPLTWDLGTLAVGDRRVITVVVTVQPWVTQTFTNTTSVGSDTPDLNPDNNFDEEPTRPPTPGLDMVKTVEPDRAVRNMPFTYTLRITNTGDFVLDPLAVTDTLPSDFYYVVGSGSPSDPDVIAEPTLSWQNLGPLAPGVGITVTFAVTATPGVTGTYVNRATVEGQYPGGTITDTDEAPVAIADPAVVVEKRVVGLDDDPVQPNYVTFTIAITNVGPSIIGVLPLLDEYDPNYLSFVDSAPYPEEDADDGLLTWHDLTGPGPYGFARNLPSGDTFIVTTVFSVAQDITTTINTAIVTNVVDIYENPANEDQDDADVSGVPTSVELLYFRAVAEPSAIRLEWATAAEIGTVGFYVRRATVANFDSAQVIAYYRGGGSPYQHIDRDVTPGQTYWYWLVEVSTDNIPADPPYGPVWGGVGIDELPDRLYLPMIQKGWGNQTAEARPHRSHRLFGRWSGPRVGALAGLGRRWE